MSEKKDITTMEDIRLLVDSFYGKVRVDQLIGGIFNGVIKDRWPEHLEKMYRFWQTVLLGEHTYYGSPFPPHARLPVSQQHFDAWLKLWHATIDEHFSGIKAEEAKWRGDKMAVMFLSKIEYYRDNSATPLL
ncbi:MAG: group III truncated hemoglobin [Chitinophaga sp.]|jgi:hemoglobin